MKFFKRNRVRSCVYSGLECTEIKRKIIEGVNDEIFSIISDQDISKLIFQFFDVLNVLIVRFTRFLDNRRQFSFQANDIG